MQDLQTLIDLLSKQRKLHISVQDLSGILNTPLTGITYENVIHAKPFCIAVKSSAERHQLCVQCKTRANAKVTASLRPLSGYCAWGLYETVMPVVISGTVAAIIYVGNVIINRAETCRRIDKSCHAAGIDPQMLLQETDSCEFLTDPDEPLRVAQIVCDYLKMLCETAPKQTASQHWLVAQMKHQAEEACYTDLTLRDLARMYHKNEKYMGRLFKKEAGVSFHEYCNQLRLKKAEKMLTDTNQKVLDIALESGFNNISYFNRSFQKMYGMSPTQYRRQNTPL